MSKKKEHNEDKPKKEGLLGRIFGKGDDTKSEQNTESSTVTNVEDKVSPTKDEDSTVLTKDQVAQKPKNSFSQILEDGRRRQQAHLDRIRSETVNKIEDRQAFENKLNATHGQRKD